MLIEDLRGNKIKWTPTGQTFLFDSERGSKPHCEARKLLKDRFPTLRILEEVSIPVIHRKKTLFLDFYIPVRKIAVEVQGIQHYQFVSAFHSSKADFLNQKKNDRMKCEWCDLNGIELIILDDGEQDIWENVI